MARVGSILDLIGDTPMVEVSPLSPNPDVRIFIKLEGRNPGGSVKDRVALSLVEQAEEDGVLKPGQPDQILIEPTSGNTGIGLALVCRVKGYHLKVGAPHQRLGRAPPASRALRGRDHRVPRGGGLQRRGPQGPAALGRASRVGLPLPVRQRGQPQGPLRGHRSRDLAGLPRGHPLRGGPGHLGHPARGRAGF